jgi:hypothetical protein
MEVNEVPLPIHEPNITIAKRFESFKSLRSISMDSKDGSYVRLVELLNTMAVYVKHTTAGLRFRKRSRYVLRETTFAQADDVYLVLLPTNPPEGTETTVVTVKQLQMAWLLADDALKGTPYLENALNAERCEWTTDVVDFDGMSVYCFVFTSGDGTPLYWPVTPV